MRVFLLKALIIAVMLGIAGAILWTMILMLTGLHSFWLLLLLLILEVTALLGLRKVYDRLPPNSG